MGAVLTVLVPSFILEMVPSLYDLQGGIAGWFAHLVHSVIFGVIFALLVAKSPLKGYVDGVGKSTVFGVGWGILLWIVATGIVMPTWLMITYYPEAPLVPYLRPSVFLAHLAYGVTVGVLVSPFVSIVDEF